MGSCCSVCAAVIADKDGWCCVEQSQSPECFFVNPDWIFKTVKNTGS